MTFVNNPAVILFISKTCQRQGGCKYSTVYSRHFQTCCVTLDLSGGPTVYVWTHINQNLPCQLFVLPWEQSKWVSWWPFHHSTGPKWEEYKYARLKKKAHFLQRHQWSCITRKSREPLVINPEHGIVCQMLKALSLILQCCIIVNSSTVTCR